MPRTSTIKRTIRTAVRIAVDSLEDRRLFAAAAPELLAVVDSTKAFGNTRESVAFYDVSSVPGATTPQLGQTPLFSIWTGYEVTDVPGTTSGDRDFEELQAFTVSTDGGTGYLLAFDSGTPGTIDARTGDANGDYDLYRLDIRGAYNDFVTNHRAKGVMYTNTTSSDFQGANNVSGIDYVATYGSRAAGPTGLPAVAPSDPGIPNGRDNTNASGADDIVFLTNASAKVGEVARRGATLASSPFFDDQDIQYVNDNTLLLMENTTASASTVTGSLGQDYSIRTIERVSTSPGQATTGADETGGYNGAATESWQSFDWTGDNYVDMDNNAATGGISDVDGMRYVKKDGVQGVWVSDRDGGGDDFSFFKLDFSTRVATKQELREGTSPLPKAFALDEDPEVNANTNDGDLSGFDVDANGNLVIRESDFLGTGNAGNQESKVITRVVTSYAAGDSDGDGIGELSFGAWDTKARLAPTLTDDAGPINSEYGVYDQAQNVIYYLPKDSLNDDLYVYDLAQEKIVYQELDATDHGYFSGNKLRAFTLQPIDNTPPTITSTTFNFAGTSQSISVAFSENVAASLAASDFTLTNTTTGAVIPSSNLVVAYDASTNIATITFTGITGSAASTVLASGRYTLATSGSGVTDAAGNPLGTTTPFSFAFQTADFNHSLSTDFSDLLTLARNYGKTSGGTFATGDANYDGKVDFSDLLALARSYGQTLPAAAPQMALSATARKSPARATTSVLS